MIYLYHKKHKITGLNYFGKTTVDPYSYNGSGKYWNSHLKKHGKEIETVEVWKFDNVNECSLFAINFSKENNIVESKDWANLKEENGLDGGFEKYRWYSNGNEDRLCINSPGKDWKLGRLNQKSITSGHKWYNNGSINISAKNKPAGNEWKEGMLTKNIPSLKDRTHIFFDTTHRNKLKRINQEKLKDGSHIFLQTWVCEHCNKQGTGLTNYKRWHGINCKERT